MLVRHDYLYWYPDFKNVSGVERVVVRIIHRLGRAPTYDRDAAIVVQKFS